MENIDVLTRSQIREYKGEHLYVINISDHGSSKPRQQLLLTFSINGAELIIDIPNTWIPLDLTSRVNINQIKDNRDFWLFINRRDLAVVSPEVAEEYLDQPDAQDEYDRIFGIEKEDSRSIRINKGGNTKNSLKKSRIPKANIKVISVMNKDITETLKLSALKNMQSQMTEDDYLYVLNQAKVGEQEKLKAWASSFIS